MGVIKDSMKIIEMSEQQIDALKAIIEKFGFWMKIRMPLPMV